MKRSFISLLICTCVLNALIAQIDWAPIGAEWYYNYWDQNSPSNSGYFHFMIEKDTIVDDVPCKKRLIEQFRADGAMVTRHNYTYESNDSIFYYNNSINEFELYFYTGVVLGDTLTLPNSQGEEVLNLISNQGDSIISGVTLRYWELEPIIDYNNYISPCGVTDFFIEGIGQFEELEFSNCIFVYPVGYGLRCYIDDQLNYASGVPCDSLALILDNIDELGHTEFSMFPNPASESVTIGGLEGDPIFKLAALSIFSSSGHLIDRRTNLKSSEKIVIETITWPKGLYLVQFLDEHGLFITQKLIIQ